MDHRRAGIGRDELGGLDAGDKQRHTAAQRREAVGEVLVRAPVEVLAQYVGSHPVRTVAGRPGSEPSLLIGLVVDRFLVWLAAPALLGIHVVLPENGRRIRMLAAELEIGLGRADVLALGLAHLLEDGSQIVYTARRLAERLVGLGVLRQLERLGHALQAGSGEKRI